MLRQLFLLLLFITLTGVNAAQGQWNYQEAEPQEFTSTDRYVIAVGEEVSPDYQIGFGYSAGIPAALDAGKVSQQTKNAFSGKGITLSENVSVATLRKGQKWLITDNNTRKYILIWLRDRYDTVRIYRPIDVQAYDIYSALEEGKEIRMKLAWVEGGALEIPGTIRNIEKDIYFIDTTLTAGVSFRDIKFSGNVNFSGAELFNAVFYNVEFEKSFSFKGALVASNIGFYDTRFKSADFSRVHFAGDTIFREVTFSEAVDFKHSMVSQLTFEYSNVITGELDFSDSHFERNVNFKGITFERGVKFSKAKFKGLANFREVQFSEADFFGAVFYRNAEFNDTKFKGKADFGSVTFCNKNDFAACDRIDFSAAAFSSQARFSFTKFSSLDAVVSFQGAQFAQKADFSYAEINTIDFNSYTPLSKKLFEIKFEPHYQALDDGRLTEAVRRNIDKRFKLSANTSVTVIEQNSKWLINDKANHLVLHVIKKQPKKDNRVKDKLEFYLWSKSTQIDQFGLIGTNYKLMNIDSRSINRFVFDEAAFQRFLKNQKELGREPFEYDNAVLALKRFERNQKWFLTRWLETVLFDWTTQYGTAKIPWGLVIYAASCIFFFAGLYRLNPNFLMFVKSDGSVDESRNDPGFLEIFWFSGNTFIPAIEFLNAGNWRPKYDAVFPGGFIRYATIATIERILGWAMVPALLSYF